MEARIEELENQLKEVLDWKKTLSPVTEFIHDTDLGTFFKIVKRNYLNLYGALCVLYPLY